MAPLADANIVLRYILDDHKDLSPKAKEIIDKEVIEVPIEVLCEVVYVLSGVYHIGRTEIRDALSVFFEATKCVLPHRAAVLKGLDHWRLIKRDWFYTARFVLQILLILILLLTLLQ
jgi:predicted nucleic-acid-binding protein